MIKKGLSPIQSVLSHLQKLDARCQEAHIEENDYTIYTYDDLEYAFNLAKSSVDKKLDFIQNQVSRPREGVTDVEIVVRDTTNLTPGQLEEFEAVFLHFDRERSNSLGEEGFGAAMASLGLNYEADEVEEIFRAVSQGKGKVNFEQFIRFMVYPSAPVSQVLSGRWSCMRIRLRRIKCERRFRTLQRGR